MQTLRTPDERFADLPDFPFEPHYAEIPDRRRRHAAGALPRRGPGRRRARAAAARRAVVELPLPAHDPAAGRRRAPRRRARPRRLRPQRQADASSTDYTLRPPRRLDVVRCCSTTLDLRDITFFGQDWGGLIGLRLVAAQPDRYARVVIGNTGLPTGDGAPQRGVPRLAEVLPGVARASRSATSSTAAAPPTLPPEVDRRLRRTVPRRHLQGRRPHLPVARADQSRRPGRRRQRRRLEGAVAVRQAVPRAPSATATRSPRAATRRSWPRCPAPQGQPHTTIEGGGHFLQEDRGPELARVIVDFIAGTQR